jgi:cytochrome c-type biogenesis protein CcmF
MVSVLGHLSIVCAFLMAVAGAVSAFAHTRLPLGYQWARRSAVAVAVLVGLAVALMEYALITHDFSVKFVADVGGPTVPLYYTIISLWAALEGSILFWAFLLSLYTVIFVLIYRGRFPSIQPSIIGSLLTISAFFLFVIAGPGDPFVRVNPVTACLTACNGPNPLLQNHWMMGVHPVLLYLGYVGLTIPFAIVIASLILGTPGPETLRLVRRWSLLAWVFLSLGIVGGMWWSYAVLGWGGYWSWDPVENASVMPWLVTTAFLHSLQVQERRQMLKAWTMALVITAFLLSILGTFLTRSGVLASVHSFTESSVGPVFLAFFGAVLLGSLALLFARGRELAAPGTLEASVCRETAFLFNNLLLVGITFTILLGTLFPLVVEAANGSQIAVGAPYFNHVAVPIGFALLFLMGIGPALPWGAAHLDELQYRFLIPVALGVAAILLLILIGVRGVSALVTFGAAIFVLAVTLERVTLDVRIRRGNTSEPWRTAARRIVRANPRRYGGYLAHIGVLLAVVGIAGSQVYKTQAAVTLRPGQSARLDGYTITYQGWRPFPQADRMQIRATVEASRAGENLGTLRPVQNIYVSTQQPVVTPAIDEEPFAMIAGVFHGTNPFPRLAQLFQGRNPFEDLYIVLDAVNSKPTGPATLQIIVNPLVGLIWLGGLILALGGIIALVPARRRRPALAAASVRTTASVHGPASPETQEAVV